MCTRIEAAADKKPNILVVWGDDIGQSNISAYTKGMMGYRTPNIDRIANEGMLFTDYYGEQSCTAGRSSFIMGQSVFRTGLPRWGCPAQTWGCARRSRPSRGLLKAQGYATGQFGKNHLGDKDEHLPTNHGFDEFFGNLYHLNAEEEPENVDYPRPGVPQEVRPPGRDPLLGQRGRHPEDRGHRTAHQEAHGDGRRRDLDGVPWSSSGSSRRRASPGSCGGAAPACTSAPT